MNTSRTKVSSHGRRGGHVQIRPGELEKGAGGFNFKFRVSSSTRLRVYKGRLGASISSLGFFKFKFRVSPTRIVPARRRVRSGDTQAKDHLSLSYSLR